MADKPQDEEKQKGYEVDDHDGDDVGVEWFYALLEAETPRTRDYAPTRKVHNYPNGVEFIISNLIKSYICRYSRKTHK